MPRAILIASLILLTCAATAPAQQGGTFTPDTTQSQDANGGGPLGTQAVPRPTQAAPNSAQQQGSDCRKMANTVSGERPATAGADTPQPQQKCEN